MVTHCLVQLMRVAYIRLGLSQAITDEDGHCKSQGVTILIKGWNGARLRPGDLLGIVTEFTEYLLRYDIEDTTMRYLATDGDRLVGVGYVGTGRGF